MCRFSYDLPAICDCSQECVSALLGDQLSGLKEEEVTRKPAPNAVDLLNRVIAIQGMHCLWFQLGTGIDFKCIFRTGAHWPILRRTAHLIDCNFIEAQRKEKEECETVNALASLTVRQSLK